MPRQQPGESIDQRSPERGDGRLRSGPRLADALGEGCGQSLERSSVAGRNAGMRLGRPSLTAFLEGVGSRELEVLERE